MTRYLLNSAVITAYGSYTYEPLTDLQAQAWLHENAYVSTIGYPETAQAMRELFGVEIPVNRRTITMQPHDEALIFRLVFPHGYRPDPAQKGGLGVAFIRQHSEIGLLRRIS